VVVARNSAPAAVLQLVYDAATLLVPVLQVGGDAARLPVQAPLAVVYEATLRDLAIVVYGAEALRRPVVLQLDPQLEPVSVESIESAGWLTRHRHLQRSAVQAD